MTDEMTWFEQEVIIRRRMLVAGDVDRPRGRDDSIHTLLNALQIIELPDGGFVFASCSYTRLKREYGERKGEDVPELIVRSTWAATLDEAVACWKKQFYSGNWTEGPHESLRITLGVGGPTVKLADPWVLYHLGVFTQLMRAADITTPQAEFVRARLVASLEAITITRIKQITKVVGRI